MRVYEVLTGSEKKKIATILGRCQNCGKKCIPTPHRINRGYADGKYTLKNLDWLCSECHSLRHFREPGIRRK